MKTTEKENFKQAMNKEFMDHCERKNWKILPAEEILEGGEVLDAVWAMRRKRYILTKQIYRWKARLNLYGDQQEFGVNYFETYSPVVNWFSHRLLLIHALIFRLYTR